MAIADTFLQGFEQGRFWAAQQQQQKLLKRQIEEEDRKTSWQKLISEAYASTLAENLAPASSPSPQPPSSLPAATPPSAMDAGAGVMPVAPPPATPPATPTTATQALSMPGEAIQTAPTQPRPNPVAMSTDMPTPPQEQPERINFYKRIEEQQKTLLTAGVPMEKVLEFKEAVTKELSRRGMPHAQRAISLQKQAEQAMSAGNVQLAKKLSAMAANDVEEAYKYVPDNGFMKVGLAPNGMLAVQAYDDGLEPDPNKPPTLLSSQDLMDSLRVAFEPGAAFTVFQEEYARKRENQKLASQLTKDRANVKAAEASARSSVIRAQAAVARAEAAKSRATTDAEKLKADKELRAAQITEAKARAKYNKAQTVKTEVETEGERISNRLKKDTLNASAEIRNLMDSYAGKGKLSLRQATRVEAEVTRRIKAGVPPFDTVGTDGSFTIGGMKFADPEMVQKMRDALKGKPLTVDTLGL